MKVLDSHWQDLSTFRLSTAEQRAELAAREQVEKTAADFAAVFIAHFLSLQRKTIEKAEMFDGGAAEESFAGLLDGEYGKLIASRDTGISNFVKQTMIRDLRGLATDAARLAARKAYGGVA